MIVKHNFVKNIIIVICLLLNGIFITNKCLMKIVKEEVCIVFYMLICYNNKKMSFSIFCKIILEIQ